MENKTYTIFFMVTFCLNLVVCSASDSFLVTKSNGKTLTVNFKDVKAIHVEGLGMIEGSLDSVHGKTLVFSYEIYETVPQNQINRKGKEKTVYTNVVKDTVLYIQLDAVSKIKYDGNPQLSYKQKRFRKNIGYVASATFVVSSYLIGGQKPSVFILPVVGTGAALFGVQYLLQPIRTLQLHKHKVKMN